MDFPNRAGADARPLVWITGAGGLTGNYLLRTAPPQFEARGITRADVDLTDFTQVAALFKREKPEAIIHCAAISKSPECEKHPELAWKVNHQLTAFLSEMASAIPFIFFSSDLVFDGEKGNYREEDLPNPLSVYAETKVRAESAVLSNPMHTVIRTSLNCGRSLERNRAFNEEMRRSWESGKCLNLFVDEYRSPIPAEYTAGTTWQVLEKGLTGIYHISGSERLSRFEIGQILTGFLPQFQGQILPGSRKDYTGPPRPRDTSLNCSKIEMELGVRMPSFREWLCAHHAEVL